MLVKTSFNDSQVMYWEPAKYVAKLRTLKTDANPLLLKTNMAAGHGGASGRYDALHEVAFDYAFILTQMGLDRVSGDRHDHPAELRRRATGSRARARGETLVNPATEEPLATRGGRGHRPARRRSLSPARRAGPPARA